MEPLADPDQYHMRYQALPPSHTLRPIPNTAKVIDKSQNVLFAPLLCTVTSRPAERKSIIKYFIPGESLTR